MSTDNIYKQFGPTSGLQVMKTFFMLNSTEYKISIAHKNLITDKVSCFKSLRCCI